MIHAHFLSPARPFPVLLLLILLLFPSHVRSSSNRGGPGGASAAATPEGARRWRRTVRVSRMSWAKDILLLGDASLKKGAVSLTKEIPCVGSAGRTLYSHPIRFLDRTTHAPASFSTRFTFSITTTTTTDYVCHSSGQTPTFGGDGLAFLITSDPNNVCSSNGHMGLFCDTGTAAAGDSNTIAVEFDANLDAALGDANCNHVGLDIGSIFSIASVNAGEAGVNLRAGRPITAWVEYNATSDLMQVWVSYNSIRRPARPLLSAAGITLSRHFQELMYVGFSASSNGKQGPSVLHEVDRWSFRTYGFLYSSIMPPGSCTGAPGVVVSISGSECLTKLLNDSAVDDYSGCRIIDTDPPMSSPRKRKSVLFGLCIVGITVFPLAAAAAAIAWCRYLVQKWRNDNGNGRRRGQIAWEDEIGKLPARLSFHELKQATEGFHHSKILGKGGTGTIYEGVLPSGCAVAVKRFDQADQCINNFFRELAAFNDCTWHRNLVPIKGWCCEKNELFLAYEYMPNGSLDKVLHATSHAQFPLPWEKRQAIILGIASAIAFLHEDCEKKIIHRDVKTCNILLDEVFNARLGNFGLTDLNEHGRSARAMLPAGTMGYLAPEYVHSGRPTEKIDVYGFGVVALEVATGRRPLVNGVALVDWVWALHGRRKLVNAADPKLEGRFNREEMCRMLYVGLLCAHPDFIQRPTMRKAIRMLKGQFPLPRLPGQKPAVRLLSIRRESSRVSADDTSEASADTDTNWFTPAASFS